MQRSDTEFQEVKSHLIGQMGSCNRVLFLFNIQDHLLPHALTFGTTPKDEKANPKGIKLYDVFFLKKKRKESRRCYFSNIMYKVIQWGYELEGEDSHEPQNQKAHETN